jgi:hypothetical protein
MKHGRWNHCFQVLSGHSPDVQEILFLAFDHTPGETSAILLVDD